MNTRKLLISTTAAIAVVGSIGFAYAQTTPATPPNAPAAGDKSSGSAGPTPEGRVTGSTNANTNTGTTTPGSTSSTDNSMSTSPSTERPAQADRN